MAKNEVKQNKDKKHFLKDFKAELKKVSWPTPRQLFNNTTVVVIIVLITALIVFVLDIAFDFVNKYGITKLQTVVQQSYSNNEAEINNEDTNSEGSEENTSKETNEQSSESNETEKNETQE